MSVGWVQGSGPAVKLSCANRWPSRERAWEAWGEGVFRAPPTHAYGPRAQPGMVLRSDLPPEG